MLNNHAGASSNGPACIQEFHLPGDVTLIPADAMHIGSSYGQVRSAAERHLYFECQIALTYGNIVVGPVAGHGPSLGAGKPR
jgi:hypothetical protein